MAAGLKLNAGHEAGADLGPMISQKALHRAEALIQSGVDQVCGVIYFYLFYFKADWLVFAWYKQGAKLVLDGRGAKVAGYPNGNWLAPTILTNVCFSFFFFLAEAFFFVVNSCNWVFFSGIQVTPDMKCYKEEIFGPVLVCS
jgi:malonate-semialdehyde dehydrogenase (acetylating)/methylmalonate-semialdehyde dehydrogenase